MSELAKIPWYLPKNRRYRRHLKFTREGKLFVFVTLGLGFGAVNTGTNLMYLVFGFMLSLIILSGILSEHALRKLKVTRRLPARAFAGEPMLIEIAVENRQVTSGQLLHRSGGPCAGAAQRSALLLSQGRTSGRASRKLPTGSDAAR